MSKRPLKTKIWWSKPIDAGVTATIESFAVEFGSTLEVPKKLDIYKKDENQSDDLIVEVLTSFRYENEGKSKTAIRHVFGKEAQVYKLMMEKLGDKDREKFQNKFAAEKHRYYQRRGQVYTRASAARFFDELNKYGMTPEKFKEKSKVDGTVLFREIKGERKLSLDKAIEYAKQLNCDPVDLLFEKQRCHLWGSVDLFNENDLDEKYFPGQIIPRGLPEDYIEVPRDIYRPGITAIRINSVGSHMHGQIAYYYRKDITDNNLQDRLCVAGTNDDTFEEFGFNPKRYWFGIFKVERGKQFLINPEPTSDKPKIMTGPFEFVAPVAAMVRPSAMRRDYEYYEGMENAARLFDYQDKMQNEIKMKELIQKYKLEEEERARKDLEKRIDRMMEKLKKQEEAIPEYLKKKLA